MLWGCRKTPFFEQPLDWNHAFNRILTKSRALRAQFFVPCIIPEVHAPGNYEFAVQILFYACCRTKSKNDRLTLSTDWGRTLCALSFGLISTVLLSKTAVLLVFCLFPGNFENMQKLQKRSVWPVVSGKSTDFVEFCLQFSVHIFTKGLASYGSIW